MRRALRWPAPVAPLVFLRGPLDAAAAAPRPDVGVSAQAAPSRVRKNDRHADEHGDRRDHGDGSSADQG